MCSYLNSDRAVYAFRRSVPEHLRPYFLTPSGKQRTEWRISLLTKDREEAKRRCHLQAVETYRWIDEAQALYDAGVPPLSSPSLELRQREEAQFLYDQQAMRWLEEQSFSEDVAVEARELDVAKILDQLRGPKEELSPTKAAIRDLIPDGEFASPAEKARAAADRQTIWTQGASEGLAHAKSLISGKPAYPSIRELFNSYAKGGELKPATVKRWRAVIEKFISHLGHDNANQASEEDVRAWKRALTSSTRLGGALSAVTVRDVYVAAVKATFNWGIEEALVTANPATSVKVRVKKAPQLRERSLSTTEASTILKATLSPQSLALSPRHALARRWVPWICAYTGARVNEITQARGTDVSLINDIWTLRITPEAGGQKADKARIVPLHSHLVEQGFPSVAASAGDDPIFYDPALARGGASANPQYKKVGERLAKWVRTLGVDDPNVQPNHGWRHLFKTLGRDHGMEEEARDAFPGHANATEGRSYGERQMPYLSRELEKIPRFEF